MAGSPPHDPPLLVERADQLACVLEDFARAKVIAVDTESNSMHAFEERVCLVQISAGGRDVVIDPLAVDIAPLRELMADPGVEKIFHAAEYDVIVLRRDHGFEFASLFDTMWAARILGWPRHGLGAILDEHFDVRLDKKMQRHDWGRRPLEAHALEYARLDVHYLESLRELILEQLEANDLLEEARAAFARVAATEVPDREGDPRDRFWRMKTIDDVPPERRGLLRALWDLRLALARELDHPPFKIASDATLAVVARRAPRERGELRKIRGLHPAVVRAHGARVLDTVRAHVADPAPVPPPRAPRPPRALTRRFEDLRRWRNERASARGVEPDVIMTKKVLISVATNAPTDRQALADLAVLDEWQLRTYGEDMLEVLANADAEAAD